MSIDRSFVKNVKLFHRKSYGYLARTKGNSNRSREINGNSGKMFRKKEAFA
jgi:hypothetical protein